MATHEMMKYNHLCPRKKGWGKGRMGGITRPVPEKERGGEGEDRRDHMPKVGTRRGCHLAHLRVVRAMV